MTRFVLGIDGGGTKTQAIIADEAGRLRGMGLGGSSNYDDVGMEKARDGIHAAVQQARRQSGLGEEPFAAAFLGMAGVVSEKDRETIRAIARQLCLAADEQVEVDHDCRIALAGGLSGRPGIVLIAGTGSSCYGRTASGASWRSGGWGHLISDEGSGYWLGIQALRCAAASYDGRLRSALEERVREALRLGKMEDLMRRLYVVGMTRSEIAALAPLVIEAARQGDATALDLLLRGASDLIQMASAVAERLQFPAGHRELALVGGLFNAGEAILAPLREAVYRRLPGWRLVRAELPPASGAALLALQSLGIPIPEGGAANLFPPGRVA